MVSGYNALKPRYSMVLTTTTNYSPNKWFKVVLFDIRMAINQHGSGVLERELLLVANSHNLQVSRHQSNQEQ